MRCSWANVAFVVVLAATVVASTTSAAAQQPLSDVRVDLNLKDADMLTATRMLTVQTGIQFIFEPSGDPFGKITLSVKGQTAVDAISYICKAAGASFRRDDNGVYIIGREAPKADPAIAPVAPKVRITKKIPVLKADIRDLYDQIVRKVVVDDQGYSRFAELKKFGRLSSNQNQRLIGYGPSVYQDGRPVAFSPTAVSETPRSAGNVEAGGEIRLPDEQGNQIGGNRGGGGYGGGGQGNGFGGGGQGNGFGGGGQNNGGGIGGQNGGGGSVYLQGDQGLVGAGIDYISYDPNDNSFVVRGTEEDINKLQNTIQMFDVAPQQVVVRVEFVTTTDTYEKSLGYEFLYQRGTVLAGTQPGVFTGGTAAPIFLNYATGNVAGRLRAAMSQGGGKVVTAPIIRTLNNQVGSVYNSAQTWMFTTNISQGGSGGNVTSYNPIAIQSTTYLSIAPRINGDGTITMYLSPNISTPNGFSVAPDGSQAQNFNEEGVFVVVRVKDGETAVVGGLTTKHESDTLLKVPVLGDLPIVGQFFRKKTNSRDNSELLIFVTPTVVKDAEDTGLSGGP